MPPSTVKPVTNFIPMSALDMPGAYGEGEDDDAAAYYTTVVEAANYSSCAAGR